jgi:hypothetical protein
MAGPQVADGRDALQFWRVAANILKKQSRITDKGWSSRLEIGSRDKNYPPKQIRLLRETTRSLGPGRIPWIKMYAKENGYEIWYLEC